MNINEIKITSGENPNQSASLEAGEKTIDYTAHGSLSFVDILSISKGLSVISEFFDVNAVTAFSGCGICAAALGKSLEEALISVIDCNPIEFVNSVIIASAEVNSDIVKMLKDTNKIAAPKFTPNALKLLEEKNISYIEIHTPLCDYKKYLTDDVRVTPLGILRQTPNHSELIKDTFKVVSNTKPTVEQIEDAVFAWKVAKYANSQAIVIAKDLKTTAISQGLHTVSVEYALDYSCDKSKDAVLASDMPVSVHDVNAAAQGRIKLMILPEAGADVIAAADKFNIALITTGFTNIKY